MARATTGKTIKVEDRFNAALAELVEQVQQDRSILAGILCGSLSHDTVWSGSDIDLLLVTIDDKKADKNGLCLYADGINVHAILMPRADFRRIAEGAVRNSFMHSLLAKGRLLYTHDETHCRAVRTPATSWASAIHRLQLLAAALQALPSVYKAHKWLVTRGDLDYAAVWILYSAQCAGTNRGARGRNDRGP